MIKELPLICPEHREAPFPPYDPAGINTSRLPDNMRPKSWDIYLDNGDADLVWETEEEFTPDDFEKFVVEIQDTFKRNNCTGKLRIHVSCRDTPDKIKRRTITIK